MSELLAVLDSQRERTHLEHKFLASLNDIDLDGGRNDTTWEDIKARAFGSSKAKGADDILALSGQNAQMKGFGIGNGLDYFDSDESQWWDE
jgi:hypothetical protein